MCGRFTMKNPQRIHPELFGLESLPELHAHYNIAPSQPVATVRETDAGRAVVTPKWGFIPSWAKEPGRMPINARSETVATSPLFRGAFKHKRGLVLADGFFEWQKSGKHKQPYLIGRVDDQPFAVAALWDAWENPEGEVVETATLLTTAPNDLMKPLHDRMPVILNAKDFDLWLDPKAKDAGKLQDLLKPCDSDILKAYPVSTWVNNPRHDDPKCVEPLPG
jgi:putative SOS response-associated peptidase YedK